MKKENHARIVIGLFALLPLGIVAAVLDTSRMALRQFASIIDAALDVVETVGWKVIVWSEGIEAEKDREDYRG